MKTLTKETVGVGIRIIGGNAQLEEGQGWKQISGTDSFVYDTYFDLAGMAVEDKTMFFTGATTQTANPPTSNAATVGNRTQIMSLMTTKPMTETELLFAATIGNLSGGSNLTFDQTVYMRVQWFNTDIDNQAAGIMIPIADNQMGSLNPTASDRVYVYHVVTPQGADGVYNHYGIRFILQADAKEEPEYQYMMRLKRSYELQQRFDRD
jgi:hypothetical protein